MRDKTPIREQVARRKPAAAGRVRPLTLADLARSGVVEIEAECEWCRHAARMAIANLAARAAPEGAYRDVVRRLRCSVCGWNRVEAWPVRDGHKDMGTAPERRRPSGLPPLDECRRFLATLPIVPGTARADRQAASIAALRERWPQLTASAALFVVQSAETPR